MKPVVNPLAAYKRYLGRIGHWVFHPMLTLDNKNWRELSAAYLLVSRRPKKTQYDSLHKNTSETHGKFSIYFTIVKQILQAQPALIRNWTLINLYSNWDIHCLFSFLFLFKIFISAYFRKISQESVMHHWVLKDIHQRCCIARIHKKSYAMRCNNLYHGELWIDVIFNHTH